MITALVRVDRAERRADALATTLAALVAAAAEGLVADAVVLCEVADEDLTRIADALGAGLTVLRAGEDPWRRGAGLAKQDWVLCLDAGDVPRDGWMRALEHFLATGPAQGRFGRCRRRSSDLGGRLTAAWRAWLAGNRVRAGDVLRKTSLVGGDPGRPMPIKATIERDPAFG